LKNHEGTEIALEQLPGIVSVFQSAVPAAFKDVHDPALLDEFKTANQGVIDALKSYETFLKSDLLPRSNGDFRIGADTYRKKLLFDEMVEIPLDRLLEIGMENLRHTRKRSKAAARSTPAVPRRKFSTTRRRTILPRANCWRLSRTC
jgi:hypothetical protein